jgi:hypothetical protein
MQSGGVESYLERTVKAEEPQSYHLLRTILGVGNTLALVRKPPLRASREPLVDPSEQ